MNFIHEFKEVLISPKSFFQQKEAQGFKGPFLFALGALALSGILTTVEIFVTGQAQLLAMIVGSQLTAGLLALLGVIIVGVLGIFFNSALDHVFVSLLGDDRYTPTFTAFAYSTAIGAAGSAVSLLVALIPMQGSFIGLISGLIFYSLLLYTFYVIARGIEGMSRLNFKEAILAIAIPVIILVAVVLGISQIAGNILQQSIAGPMTGQPGIQ